MEIGKGTVLLVEDDPLFRALIRDHLCDLGLTVVEAGEGRTAIFQLQRLAPVLVCLDLMLPAVSGLQICETIRATPSTRQVPILMMSARSSPQDRAHAEEAGASGYLVKPFTRDDLIGEIKRLLAPKQRRARR